MRRMTMSLSPRSSAALLLATVCLASSPPAIAGDEQAKPLRVTIDVKPGDNPTTLEPKREGMVPIAILSSKDFDAAQVDPTTIRAGATGTEGSIFKSMMEDVDHDKDVDMLLLFPVRQLALTCAAKSITVKGKTEKGQDFEGTEAVTMVGC
jgi:hypothetical protein